MRRVTGCNVTLRAVVQQPRRHAEHFYFAFAPENLVVICDLPDNEAAAAFSLAINNSGAAKGHVTALLSPEEMDRAVTRSPAYRAPGES
jgi:uncharacterized protein with GYD domain